MSNMSYCRFENTLADLRDCRDALDEKSIEDLSETEQRCAWALLAMCKLLAEDFEAEIEAYEAERAERRRIAMQKASA